MLELLFEAADNDIDQPIEESEILDQFISFFMGGMDTTSHLVHMALYCLQRDPVFLEDLRREVVSIYGDGRQVTAEKLNSMKIMNSFLKEVLRLYSPAPGLFPRKAVRDTMIGDLRIKKGTLIQMDFMSNHNSERNFDDANKFDPYRFLIKKQPEEPYAFIPFSIGARNCIGQHLAMFEANIAVSEFITNFDFRVKEDYELKFTARLVYEPLDPIILNFKKR
jgi:cytochrome P450